MSLEYLEIKIISANLEHFEGTEPTSYIELEWLPGHETVKTNVRVATSRPEWGDDGDSFTAPIDSDSMVISVK